jgi:Protein of unknown function (DUF2946)
MGPGSNTCTQRAPIGDTRRFVVALLGVWAMALQLMIPFAGALAAQSGDEFWVTLCTTAGVEDIYLGDGESAPGDTTSNSAGCDVCTICACSAGVGCGCGAIKLALKRAYLSASVAPPTDVRLSKPDYVNPRHTRGPPT